MNLLCDMTRRRTKGRFVVHFAVVKLSFIMEDARLGLLYFPSELDCNVVYKRCKMAIIILDERDLGSGIVLHYRSLRNINYKPKSVAQSNSRSLN